MNGELDSASDPVELIPGDPGSLQQPRRSRRGTPERRTIRPRSKSSGPHAPSSLPPRTAAGIIGAARDMAPPQPGLLSEVGHDITGALSSAWHGAVHLGEDTLDVLASVGNAAVNDPTATLSAVGGMLLAGVSAGGEGLGVALDATGVGAVADVPLNALSAAGLAGGVTLAGVGLAKMTADAAGPDRVSISQASTTGAVRAAPDRNGLPSQGNIRYIRK